MRDAFGNATCVPVGDCAAAFPPADATLFVDPNGASDGTHFTTIGAALAAAPSGAVVAIASGTYPESLVASKDVTLVGRCAAQVSVVGGGTRVRGLYVDGVKVVARGLTITKQFIGVSVAPNGDLTMSDSVLDDNEGQGFSLSDGAAKLAIERVVVRNTREASATGDGGHGLNVQAGSTATVKDCSFSANRYANVRVSSGSTATLDRVVLRDGKPTRTQDVGRALSVQASGSVTLTHGALVDNYEIAIVAADGTKIVLEDVFVGRTKLAATGEFGRALDLFGGADVKATRFHAYENHDASIIAVEENTHLSLTASSIVDTGFNEAGEVGRSLTLQQGAVADVDDTAFVDSKEVGVAVFGKGSSATLKRSIVTGSIPTLGDRFGHGIMSADGGKLILEDCEISTNSASGVAVGDGSGRITRTRIRGNAVGLYVQDGTTLQEDQGADPTDLQVTVSADSIFESNGTRVSAGVLPLPGPSILSP